MAEGAALFTIFSISPLVAQVCAASVALLLLVCVVACSRSLAPLDRRIASGLFIAALVVIAPSLEHAAQLRISPDSVEYAVSAARLAHDGRYEITLAGQHFPPRYPLGFPLFVILPALAALGAGSLGNGVWGVAVCGALGVSMAFLVGLRFGGRAAGWIAAGLVLMLPGYIGSAQEVLSIVPAAAVSLLGLFCATVPKESGNIRWIGAGLAGMVASACRPLSGVIFVPLGVAWWMSGARSIKSALCLFAPSVAWLGATLAYNQLVFGDALRSGYHFWCPIPYDYPQLLISLGYLVDNFSALSTSGVLIILPLAVLGLVLHRRENAGSSSQGVATQSAVVVAALLMIAFHLVYFFAWDLYFVPCAVILAPVAGACGSYMIERAQFPKGRIIALSFCALGLVSAGITAHRAAFRDISVYEQLGTLLGATEELQKSSPVVVVTGRNPALVEAVVKTPTVPISRRVEYASKLVAPRRIPLGDVSSISPTDHRNAALKAGGAGEVYRKTVLEAPEELRAEIGRGVMVLVDLRSLTPEEIAALKEHVSLEEVASGVARAGILPAHA